MFIGSSSSHQKCSVFGDSAQDVFSFIATQLVVEPPERHHSVYQQTKMMAEPSNKTAHRNNIND